MAENDTTTTETATEEVKEQKATLVDGSVKDVLERVGNDPKLATRAFKLEVNGKARKSLTEPLKDVIVSAMPLPQWARKAQVGPNGARFQMAKTTVELFRTTEAFAGVEDIIDAGTWRDSGVRLDNDAATLRQLSKALRAGSDEVFEQSIADFKTLLRSSRIAASQAEAAANYVPPVEEEPVVTDDEAAETDGEEVAETVTA